MRRKEFLRVLTVIVTIILLGIILAPSTWAADYKAIYKFRGGKDGAMPDAGLTLDAAGNLYGTTRSGGGHGCGVGCGTVFKLAPNPDGSWSETVLHSFKFKPIDVDGLIPNGPLVLDTNGDLYGTTLGGGPYDGGTVFKLTHNPDDTWTEIVLHAFWSGRDSENGWIPNGFVFDSAGNLFGTTALGGYNCIDGEYSGCGTVYKLTPQPDGTWTSKILHRFGVGDNYDGVSPNGLVFDATGKLYGTTWQGGKHDLGAIFELTPNPNGSWTEQVVFSFRGLTATYPDANLIFDPAGYVYGTTTGYPHSDGTVFKLTPNPDGSWTWSKVHAFKGPDGANPYAGVIFDGSGNLYGTTTWGGAHDGGTVFKLAQQPDGHWKRTTLHAFASDHPERGLHPRAGLAMDAAGNLYGTTYDGGHGYGVVFKIKP